MKLNRVCIAENLPEGLASAMLVLRMQEENHGPMQYDIACQKNCQSSIRALEALGLVRIGTENLLAHINLLRAFAG